MRWWPILFLIALPAWAQTLTGKVIRIADGDTLTVLVDNRQHRIRLVDIDAPEMGQPFGKRSRTSLAELCAARIARVEIRGMDRYGRVLGHVACSGVDVNAEQVSRGMAWVYRRYAPQDSTLYQLERQARSMRRGLWSHPAPVPPWEVRDSRT